MKRRPLAYEARTRTPRGPALSKNALVKATRGPPTDNVLAHHRAAFEPGDVRVLGEPEVELVSNEGYVEGPDAPSEVYRLTFHVEPVR